MRRWRSYEEAYTELSSLEPARRIPFLLTEFQNEALRLSTEDVRRLFVFAWDDAATPRDLDHEVVRMLRWIAPVRDAETYLNGTITLFRPADPNDSGVRWTLDEAHAAANGSNGVTRGKIAASNVLAHFTTDGLDQVLVDPDRLIVDEPL